MMQPRRKPGSTTIVCIIPEGTTVKAGEVLCKLDSSAYEDEEQAQLIRFYKPSRTLSRPIRFWKSTRSAWKNIETASTLRMSSS